MNDTPSKDIAGLQLPNILLVAVSKIETQTILSVFAQSPETRLSRRTIDGKTYYDLGVWGNAKIILVQSEMGSTGPGAALLTIHKAINVLYPAAIILVAIAFGVNQKKQKIGDILVAEKLQLYESEKLTGKRNLKVIARGERVKSSTFLLDKFRSGELDWHGSKIHFGLLVSGEKLIDNRSFRDQLLKTEPEAIGGEMEGSGLYTAASDAKSNWILVKAICDWADGYKAKNKEARQRKAAQNAASFVLHVIKQGGLGADIDNTTPTSTFPAEWEHAEKKYRERVGEEYKTTRLLGHAKPITIEDIYTDVYVLDRLTAFRHFDLKELQARPLDRELLHLRDKRKPALDVVRKEKRLFILGKPGAGKTTFLKYLTLQACKGAISKIPIFISMKEWGDSKPELMAFIVQQFGNLGWPKS